MPDFLATEILDSLGKLWEPLRYLGLFYFAALLYHFSVRLPQKPDLTGEHVDAEETIKTYQAFRDRVRYGGLLSGGYSTLLHYFLEGVDRFFHDEGKTAPSWTSDSMDRLLGLALVYPVLSMLAVWWVTGEVGSTANALGLTDVVAPGLRAASAASSIVLLVTFLWSIYPPQSHKTFMWRIVRFASMAVAMVLVVTVGYISIGASVNSVIIITSMMAIGTVAGAGTVLVLATFAVLVTLIGAGAGAGTIALVLVVTLAVLLAVDFLAKPLNFKKTGLGWWLYFPIFLALPPAYILGLPQLFSLDAATLNWTLLLIILGLPLINALFDWLSLGLTRKLIRKGLKKGGAWPFIYAGADVFAAIALLFILLVACLGYIHGLNLLALSAGSPHVFDMPGTLILLRSDPSDPSLWWIYIMVFTTFIPSLVNLVLGGLAILRGIPGLNGLLVARFLPQDPRHLTILRRFSASVGLSVQITIALAGAICVGWLAFTVIFIGLDHVGLGLVAVAEMLNSFLNDLFPVALDAKI